MSAEEAENLQSQGLDEFGNEWVVAKAPPRKRTLEDTIALWWSALGSTVLISAAPFFILFFIDLDDSEKHESKLKVLLAFAAGGLLGDAFLHLMPHSIGEKSEDHSHAHSHSHSDAGHGHSHDDRYLNCNLWVLTGMLTFLVIEKLARVMGIGHSHEDGHGHLHGVENKSENSEEPASEEILDTTTDKESTKENIAEKTEDKPNAKSFESTEDLEPLLPKMDVSGYLNLAADFSHNFTDGLAIGASYLAGNTIGLITTFTILIHEVPHEIGDFAILIKSGCPRMTAIFLQSTTRGII